MEPALSAESQACGVCASAIEISSSGFSITVKFNGGKNLCCIAVRDAILKLVESQVKKYQLPESSWMAGTTEGLIEHSEKKVVVHVNLLSVGGSDQDMEADDTKPRSISSTFLPTPSPESTAPSQEPNSSLPDPLSPTTLSPNTLSASSDSSSSSSSSSSDDSDESDWSDHPEMRDKFIELKGLIRELKDMLKEKERDRFHTVWMNLVAKGMNTGTFIEFRSANEHRCGALRREIRRECERILKRGRRERVTIARLWRSMP